MPQLGPRAGPHAGRLNCGACGRFLQWAPRAVVRSFLEEKVCGMVGGINKVFLMGNISKFGVEVRYAPSGAACASFTLVVEEKGQDGRCHPTLIPCECWGKRAEAAGELEAGQLALFEGKVAKRKKGEVWELLISGFEVTPILVPQTSLTGNSN